MMLLQLEMDQPVDNKQQQQQQQQSSTVMSQPAAAVQPVAFVPPSATPSVCESYSNIQSIIIGVILIIAGILSILFNILGIVLGERLIVWEHGFLCGIMVSWCFMV